MPQTTLATLTTPKASRRGLLRRSVAMVLLGAFVLGWWAFLRPASLGGPLSLIVVSGSSMEPGMHTGDLALVYERDDYSIGDVIAFRHRTESGELGSHVIHRIIGGDAAGGFQVQGDNNTWVDPWEPTGDEVSGTMALHLPRAGTAVNWIAEPFHMGALFAAVAVGLVLAGPSRTPDGSPSANEHQPTGESSR